MTENLSPGLERITETLADVPTPAVLADLMGTICWQNKASLGFGGSRVGLNVVELVTPVDRPKARAVFDRVLAGQGPEEFTGRANDTALTCASFRARATLVAVPGGESVLAIYPLPVATPADGPTSPPGDLKLGLRQQEILRMLAAGRTTDQIAEHLSLSRTTVRNNIAELLSHLGVHSRLQAVAAARNAGLIDS